ncbi:MAG: putative rane protein [Evtepia sp.]|jgi:heptaprenyl diphosphate synthase|nr:putative rane protein [Evtepia sp.]
MKTRQLTFISMLSATALIIFVVEAQIPVPVPIPGLKLGLSNVVILFALCTMGRRDAGFVLLIRILLGNFVAGNLMAMLYSLAGGTLCFLLMALMKPLFSTKQIWILSIFGAIAHNIGQLAIAVWITGTPSILVYAPILLLCGIITGFFTGQCAQAVILHMQRLKS